MAIFQTVTALMAVFGIGTAVFLVLYTRNRHMAFAPFWLLLGLVFLALSLINRILMERGEKWPAWFFPVFIAVCAAALVWFAVLLNLILRAQKKKPEAPVDFVVILGAQVRGKKASRMLRLRCEAAIPYLEAFPQVRVVASGGQGRGELITEARCMADYLVSRGIERERILEEDRSVTTYENVLFSRELIAEALDGEKRIKDVSLAVATTGFHIYRSMRLIRAQGFREVYALPADSDPVLKYNYYVRECFAIMKDLLLGNLSETRVRKARKGA